MNYFEIDAEVSEGREGRVLPRWCARGLPVSVCLSVVASTGMR